MDDGIIQDFVDGYACPVDPDSLNQCESCQ